jgi:hypothetical protein
VTVAEVTVTVQIAKQGNRSSQAIEKELTDLLNTAFADANEVVEFTIEWPIKREVVFAPDNLVDFPS